MIFLTALIRSFRLDSYLMAIQQMPPNLHAQNLLAKKSQNIFVEHRDPFIDVYMQSKIPKESIETTRTITYLTHFLGTSHARTPSFGLFAIYIS